MRLTFDWAMATTLPTVMLRTASPHMRTAQSGCTRLQARSTRRRAANAPALEPVAMKAATDVGAPSYTSEAHMWKGTEEILKPKPTRRRAKPITSIGSRPPPADTTAAMRSRLVEPVAPNTRAIP